MEIDKEIFNPDDLLENLMDDKELCVSILEGFLADIPEQITKLEQAVADNDVQTAERQAHTIKGACSNVGANELQKTAYKLEMSGKEGDLDSVQRGLPELKDRFGVLKEMVAATIQQW